jgi:5-methylthioribose kinase
MVIKSHLSTINLKAFFLDLHDLPGITQYLRSRNWIGSRETVCRAERAGEGNMNCTLRVETGEGTFILKQARPWVEKYPHIPAPWDRTETEARFYKRVQAQPTISSHMPRLLQYDPANRTLMVEDLPKAKDFTFTYQEGTGRINESDLTQLTQYLTELQTCFRGQKLSESFSNREMRKLNHEHIFVSPLRPDNGLTLDAITPGLQRLAKQVQSDRPYLNRVEALGNCYLHGESGTGLVHGDYFPGSWLKAEDRVYVIDPEFCFAGRAEWDLGTMVGHLYLAGAAEEIVRSVFAAYAGALSFDASLARQFAGVEIMRRLVGVAQLPLPYGLPDKESLLTLSRRLVLS